MNNKYFFLLFLTVKSIYSQTFFTVPQNVWKFSVTEKHGNEKWKGHDGKTGWLSSYTLNGIKYNFRFNQNKNKMNLRSYAIDYGLTNDLTFSLRIAQFTSVSQNDSWSIKSDSSTKPIDELLSMYYPKERSSKGIGDLMLGLKYLLRGDPAWKKSKAKFSIFAGIDYVMPFAEDLIGFKSNDLIKGVPKQFLQLPLGEGVPKVRIKSFGEFYTRYKKRLVNVNWSLGINLPMRNQINPRITFLWIQDASMDSISQAIGDVIYKKGPSIEALISGQIEIIPKKLFVSGDVKWESSLRDKYHSNSPTWNDWMTKRTNYDTRSIAVLQSVRINYSNLDQSTYIGPFPFEIEIGSSWNLPFLTYHKFAGTSIWLKLSSYFQAW